MKAEIEIKDVEATYEIDFPIRTITITTLSNPGRTYFKRLSVTERI